MNGAPEEMRTVTGKSCGRRGIRSGVTRYGEGPRQGGTEPALPGTVPRQETGLHYNLHRYYDPDVGRFR